MVVAAVGIDGAAAEVRAVLGDRTLGVLVNNAAVDAPVVSLDDAEFASGIDAVNVNLGGPFRLIGALATNLRRAERPLIVNVSSCLASLSGQARGDYADLRSSYAYRLSKAAQNMLTIAVAWPSPMPPRARAAARDCVNSWRVPVGIVSGSAPSGPPTWAGEPSGWEGASGVAARPAPGPGRPVQT